MNSGKVTIHDLAKALNIDSSTVSRALNDSPRISKKTKEKIREKAKAMGYQRNSLASHLRTNKTYSIGVIVPRLSRNFFSNVISGIEETAYQKGYSVIICQSLESLEREKKILETLLANRVDGILISISMQTNSLDHLDTFLNYGAPMVFYDRPCNYKNCTSVSIDDYDASFRATAHLIENGCKTIVHFGGPQNIGLYQNRKNGYIAALNKYGLPVSDALCFETKLSEKDGEDMAKKVLDMGGVDGIYSANDTSAISAMQYFKTVGIKVPEQIAIVGFNNDPISSVIEPPLTTINQPDYEMGYTAAAHLIKQIEGRAGNGQPLVLTSELIVRNSSKFGDTG